ncbi:hypothetical protein BS47DRAFT_1464023 [Hydnum rufescens UP504]|uniref:High affinity methionine permease n=1 Tax=Hydnum rufescens UP504 TaxID=1448309 RepID=A0A9P6DRQ1_9AGAM|nr:hypothetical protein BS47DRAFT_1464023 [Hydnum rufescens UP504]
MAISYAAIPSSSSSTHLPDDDTIGDSESLLQKLNETEDSSILHEGEQPTTLDDELFASAPSQKRVLGLGSSVFLIFNRIIGTGVFATPSSILASSGSVGLALLLWVIGAIIASAGLAVYIEWGTGLPRSGGEKNYLEYVYSRPKFLVTCMYASYACLLGWAAGNSVVFGEYILHAADVEVTRWNQRGIALVCVTFAWLVHTVTLNWGLRLQNILGTFKLAVLVLIALSGFAALAGHVRLPEQDKPHNFQRPFEGTTSNVNGLVTGLYNVIWSFIGYSNANYAMGEMKNPIKTIKRAGPIAMASVTVLYLLINIAYFAAVPKTEILTSGRIIAALYFRNMFGPSAEKVLSIVVALSALGNVMSVIFSHGRVNQELAREGVIPFSSFFASSKPFGSPFNALGLHWLMCVVLIVGPKPGDAYNLVLNVVSYPLAVINAAISAGLIYVYVFRSSDWNPPFRAPLLVTVFFLLSNVFLSVAPLVPPLPGHQVYESLPYYLHVVVGLGVLALGALYWLMYWVVLPRLGHYTLERIVVVKQQDGVPMASFVEVPT